MFCKNCGKELNPGTDFCTGCGKALTLQEKNELNGVATIQPGNTYTSGQNMSYYGPVDEFNGHKSDCIAGFVLSLCGATCIPLIGGILGLIFSNKALNGGCTSGLAKAGKIISIIDLALCVFVIVLLMAVSCRLRYEFSC